MTTLWTIPLHGVPCVVCGTPASAMVVSETSRVITHRLKLPCIMPNPPKPKPGVPSVECRRCHRVVGGYANGYAPRRHNRPDGSVCASTRRSS